MKLFRTRQESTASQNSIQDGDEASIIEESDLNHTMGESSTLFANNEQEGKKALNWKKYLKDEKVALDALKFQKGRKTPNEDNP